MLVSVWLLASVMHWERNASLHLAEPVPCNWTPTDWASWVDNRSLMSRRCSIEWSMRVSIGMPASAIEMMVHSRSE